VKKLNY